MPHYLTKSRFKLANECPTKIFYSLNRDTYQNLNSTNDFLMALAEGGYQVGELAKCYHPGGVDIETLNSEEALEQTNALLQNENAIIYEAAIQYKNCFIRADILLKKGDSIEIHEVKAKSCDFDHEDGFRKGMTKWKPYLEDVAFQVWVTMQAFPQYDVKGFLKLANKNATASIDGLNQKFLLQKDANGRTKVEQIGDCSPASLGNEVLISVNVDSIIQEILTDTYEFNNQVLSFTDYIEQLTLLCKNGNFIPSAVGRKCRGCEFNTNADGESSGLLSGFKNCWSQAYGLTNNDFLRPMIFEVNNLHYTHTDEYLANQQFFMDDIDAKRYDDNPETINGTLDSSKRKALQIYRTQNTIPERYLDIEGLQKAKLMWKFPYHMIDFETTMAAIPFNKGRRPYEQTAFQFSHHVIYENGKIEHKTEYINTMQGEFPNFNFIRKLRECLNNDEGTIFRYAPHENTILNAIYNQLYSSDEADKKQLMDFICSISHSSDSSDHTWSGNRDMVDMWDLVKKHYWHPLMKGSNSIKQVLPAVLQDSTYLQNKYSKPVYGTVDYPSKNFNKHTWIQFDSNNHIINPYKLLPPIHEGIENSVVDELMLDSGKIADGGAAMTAFAKMQFCQMTETERKGITSALLKYCELDTLAMVMIMEYWLNGYFGDIDPLFR